MAAPHNVTLSTDSVTEWEARMAAIEAEWEKPIPRQHCECYLCRVCVQKCGQHTCRAVSRRNNTFGEKRLMWQKQWYLEIDEKKNPFDISSILRTITPEEAAVERVCAARVLTDSPKWDNYIPFEGTTTYAASFKHPSKNR